MPLSLNSRDLNILWYAWQSRFLAVRQVHRAFWPAGSGAEPARVRLVELTEAGYLGREVLSWGSIKAVHFITSKGAAALLDSGLPQRLLAPEMLKNFEKGPKRPQAMGEALWHDLMVTDLRLGLEASGVDPLSWVSDYQLRKVAGGYSPNVRVADGLFAWEVDGTTHMGVLEFERKHYSSGRWPSIMERLRNTHPDRSVFFVVEAPTRSGPVIEAIRRTKVYDQAPHAVLVGSFASVAEKGLLGDFRDLQDQPFAPVDGAAQP